MGLRLRCLSILVWLVACVHLSCVQSRKATATAAPKRSGQLSYHLSIPDPSRQYVKVRIDIPRSAARTTRTELAIPAWAPGSYLIRDFGRHVYKVSATTPEGTPLDVRRDGKQQWTVHNKGQAFSVHYQVFADELSVRTAFVNDAMALINNAAILMYLRGAKSLPVNLDIAAPPDWGVYTQLEPGPQGFQSPNYDELLDAPILMGAGAYETKFQVGQTAFRYVAIAPSGTNANFERLGQDAQNIVKSFETLMGELNFGQYSFLVVLDPNGRGGLEHKYSTAMILPTFSFADEDGYLYAQSLLAHEFFHAWNVKRIRDTKLGPFDYDKEVYTDLLWFHEGFTETMTSQALRVAKAYDTQDYLDEVADSWGDYVAHPGRNHDSIAQLSKDAWIKFYRKAANLHNTSISYYHKGDLIGVCLDLTIRLAAAKRGKKAGLDSMFRNMWGGRAPDKEVRIRKADIIAAASREAGEDLSGFFEKYVYGTQELPLPELLTQAGVEVKAQKPWLDKDGKAVLDKTDLRYYTGAKMSGAIVKSVAPESPAAKAKLMAHDEIIAVDGRRWRKGQSLQAQLVGDAVGRAVPLALFRRGRLVRLELAPEESPLREWNFALGPPKTRSALQSLVLEGWLGLSKQAQGGDKQALVNSARKPSVTAVQ